MKRKTTDYVIVHHSWTTDNKLLNDTEAIRRYHMGTNGWSDIGYHFVLEQIDNEWVWKKGRPIEDVGAHCKENRRNYTSIGLCVVGNFDKEAPPLIVYRMVGEKIKELNHKYKKELIVEPHNKHAPKTCPGKKFNMDVLESYIDTFYKDVPTTDYAYREISNVSNMGIMNGVLNGCFNPDGYLTRRELAIVIDRMVNYFYDS